MTPSSISLTNAQYQQFAVAVTGTANTGVVWSINPPVGTITSTGLYTAPSSISSAQTITVIATSVADSTKSASAAVSLVPVVQVSVSPSTASLQPSQSVTLTAAVTGSTNTGVTWTSPSLSGGLATSGMTAIYTAPAKITTSQTVTITVSSVADPTKSVSAILALVPAIAVSLSPGAVTLTPSATQQFSAAVTGSTNTGVIWSLNPLMGSIDQNGVYTAPASLGSSQAVTVIAQSAADPTKMASASLTVQPTGQVQFTLDSNGLTGLSYAGQTYFFARPYFEVGNVTFRSPAGSEKGAGWIQPTSKTVSTSPAYFEHVYNQGQPDQYTVRQVFSVSDTRTLQVDTYVTNNDPTDTLARIDLALVNFQIPGAALQYNNNVPLSIGQPADWLPVGFLSNGWGSLAFWLGDYSKNTTITGSYGSTSQTQFNLWLDNYSTRPYNGTTKYFESTIAPGATQQMTYFLRFGAPIDTPSTLAPDAFQLYRTAYPSMLNWPDRRPIGNWFISELTQSSAKNPRGYLWDSTLDVSNTTTFQTAILAKADEVIARMNNITPKPQGIMIWDLEGQEFYQYFTYVGHPDLLPQISPEMDGVADSLFAKFTNAGYLVGVTLRPNDFGAGNQLPATCQSGSLVGQRDVFINLSAPFPFRGYECSATNTWSQDGAHQPYYQTISDDDDAVIANLAKKAAYAHNRWGTRLFYVDSNVWLTSGVITDKVFRALMQQFPDCLFMPEWKNPEYFGSTAPYSQANMGVPNTPAAWKAVYPNAFSVINIGTADLVNQYNDLLQGVQAGDIMLFRAWWDSPEIPVMQTLYSTVQ